MTPESGRPMPAPIPKIALTIPSPAGIALARERVAHDAERQREDAARDALQDAPGDDDLDRPAQGADDRARREDEQDRGEHAALAVDVAELADDRRRDRGRQQERGQEPGGRRRCSRGGRSPISGSAGMTSVCDSANDTPASEQHEQHLRSGARRRREVRERRGTAAVMVFEVLMLFLLSRVRQRTRIDGRGVDRRGRSNRRGPAAIGWVAAVR